jgi:hypothetical protein
MRRSSTRLALPFAALTLVWAIGLASSISRTRASAQATGQAGPRPQMAEEIYRDIQVLKGLPVDEFIGTMGVISTTLSLDCSQCHTGAGTANPQWEADTPRKRTARRMIEMVRKINQENFGGRQVVTCWTCHRGNLSPAVTVPLDFAYGETTVVEPPDVVPRATSGGPTLDQVFDKFIQALGGAPAVNRLTSYIATGTSLLFDEPGKGNPAEIYAKAPNQLAMFVHQREGDVARTFDGTMAWFQLPLTVTPQYPLGGTLQEGARFEAAMAFPWRIRDFFSNWRVSYPTRVSDSLVNVIQGSTPTGMIGTLYFDAETGLLKRMIRYANTAVGRMPSQIDYSDYRPVDGVMMPFRFSYTWVSEREEWMLTGYEPNAAIDASKFGRPANRATVP